MTTDRNDNDNINTNTIDTIIVIAVLIVNDDNEFTCRKYAHIFTKNSIKKAKRSALSKRYLYLTTKYNNDSNIANADTNANAVNNNNNNSTYRTSITIINCNSAKKAKLLILNE